MWIAVGTDVVANRKVLRYALRMGISRQEAVGRLVELWTAALNNAARDGTLAGVDEAVLVMMLGWGEADARRHIAALLATGLLERRDGGLAVPNWEQYQKPWYDYQDRLKRDRMRKAAAARAVARRAK